jgi:hypothetical protein
MPAASVEDSTAFTTAAFKDCVFEKSKSTTISTSNCARQYSGTVGVITENNCGFIGVATFEGCTFSQNQGQNVITRTANIYSQTNLTIIDETITCEGPEESNTTADVEDSQSTDVAADYETCECDGACVERANPPECQGYYNVDLYDDNCDAPPPPVNVSRPLSALPTAFIPFKASDFLSTSSPAYQAIVRVRVPLELRNRRA